MLVYGECECHADVVFVSCVHPVAVLNAAFCMTCSLCQQSSYPYTNTQHTSTTAATEQTSHRPLHSH